MFVNDAFVETLPCPPAERVARLRMLMADEVLVVDTPYPLEDIAAFLETGEEEALDVLRELGRDGFLERLESGAVRIRSEESSGAATSSGSDASSSPPQCRWPASSCVLPTSSRCGNWRGAARRRCRSATSTLSAAPKTPSSPRC